MALATELQHLDLGGEMFGCIIHDAPKFVEEFIIDNTMGAISGPAMDDAMANGDERDILQCRFEPVEQVGECCRMVFGPDRPNVLMLPLPPDAERGAGLPKAVELSP